MKLSADIIFEHLSSHFKVEMHGLPNTSMRLPRPVFYMDHQTEFLANHLYLASADHLPAYPKIQRGVVLICIGESLRLSYYYSKCTVVLIKDRCDYFTVYLKIQEIYNKFDSWNDELFELFKKDADIQKILECSAAIFQNPLLVIDQDFHFLATTGFTEAELMEKWKDDSKNLSQYSISHFLTENEPQINEKKPMFLKIIDKNALCVNLFDKKESYIGCLCILTSEDHSKRGMEAAASYLARIIEQSIEKNPSILATEHNTYKNILRDLMHDVPISPNQRWLLNTSQQNKKYACVTLHSLNQENPLPASYICNVFEATFFNSFAFPVDAAVAGFIDLTRLCDSKGEFAGELDRLLVPMLNSMRICAGISNEFLALDDAKIYFQQAEAAIKNGSMIKPQENHYYFSDYALMEMVINSLSGFPIETYFPNGLKELFLHDENSAVSYLQTLNVFLKENMSYSKTANIMYVHRSTLIDRIARIERDLGVDLRDPDKRLHLQLLLKAIEIKDAIKVNS